MRGTKGARLLSVLIAVVLGGVILAGTSVSLAEGTNGSEAPKAMKAQVSEAYGKLPLHFEANQGQTDAQVQFLSRGIGYTLFLTPTEAVLVLRPLSPPPTAGEGEGGGTSSA